jgi:hypothetical protein
MLLTFCIYTSLGFSQSVANSDIKRKEFSGEPFMLRVMYPVVDEMSVVHFLTVPVLATGGAPFNVPRLLCKPLHLPFDGEQESRRDNNLISLKKIKLSFREQEGNTVSSPTVYLDVTGFSFDVLPEVSIAQSIEATIMCLRESFPLGQSATLNIVIVAKPSDSEAFKKFNGPIWSE